MSKVIWITGYPGSGKTTTAKLLCEDFRSAGMPAILLDGDQMRAVFGVQGGYTPEERIKLSYQYSRLANLLSQQGHTVIVATVSLFHEIHQWNRENIDGYIEVYLDVDAKVLHARDQKKLYSNAKAGKENNVLGINLSAEIPLKPDIRIINSGDLTARQVTDVISKYCKLTEE